MQKADVLLNQHSCSYKTAMSTTRFVRTVKTFLTLPSVMFDQFLCLDGAA